MTRRAILLTVVFTVALLPYSVGSISANYLFVAIPLVAITLTQRVARIPNLIGVGVLLYTAVLVVAWVAQPSLLDLSVRRFGSFVLFMTMFAYAVQRVDGEMVQAFKAAVVVSSAMLSIYSAYLLRLALRMGLDPKEAVGSQRYGFVYLMAFWIVFSWLPARRGTAVLKLALLPLLAGGLLLTYSRSSVVAFAASAAFFGLSHLRRFIRRPTASELVRLAAIPAAAAVLIVVLATVVPNATAYFENRFAMMTDPQILKQSLGDPDSSDGTRVYLAQHILSYVSRNPLTGSGFLGVWILPVWVAHTRAGSSHNQYLDVLLRTGVFGFAFYLYLLYRIQRGLFDVDRGLAWGFVGVLAYGLFHETFKESHGAFLLAFAVGILAELVRNARGAQQFGGRGSDARVRAIT